MESILKKYKDKPTSFETQRFFVASISPHEARKLMEILLQDEALASRVSWMNYKSMDGALREAFGIELQYTAGQIQVWSILPRERRMQIGAIIARNSIEGIDVEVLVASQFFDDGISDETSDPVIEWLSNSNEYTHRFT